MDFKRIEWIFFLAFLGLNIFLFGIYREGQQEESNVSSSSQTESIESRLEKDNISYKGTLSSERLEGYYLSGEQTNFSAALKIQREKNKNFLRNGLQIANNTLTSVPSKNYFIDPKKIDKDLSTFLNEKNALLFGDEYQYLPEFSHLKEPTAEIVAAQSYKGIPFRDDTAKLSILADTSGELWKISKYSQTHIENIEELRDKTDLYSNRDAIDTLYMNNRIPSNSKITFIKLAYSRIYKIREKNVYVPVWFVGISTGEDSVEIEQVNAVSNTIITNNTVPKVEKH